MKIRIMLKIVQKFSNDDVTVYVTDVNVPSFV
jgi:hypothetical protein